MAKKASREKLPEKKREKEREYKPSEMWASLCTTSLNSLNHVQQG